LIRHFIAWFFVILLITSCTQDRSEKSSLPTEELTIYYTQNLLNFEFWDEIFADFSSKAGFLIKTRSFSDSWELMQFYKNERDSSETVDLFLGIDNFILPDLQESDLIQPLKIIKSGEIEIDWDQSQDLFPLAYSYLGFIYNSEFLQDPPLTFGAMQDGIWKDSIIMFDPRNNSIGRGMLLWSVAAFGNNGYGHFLRSIKNNIFSNCSNFDNAYSQFLAREAPLVLALSTTSCYHNLQDSTNIYRSVIPTEGGFLYVWGAAAVKGTGNSNKIRQLYNYLHQTEFQAEIPLNLWMYPVVKDIKIPKVYSSCSKPVKILTIDLSRRNYKSNLGIWLKKWKKIML